MARNNPHDFTDFQANRTPLWLVVYRDGTRAHYEFAAGSDVTVVAGASPNAQIYIAQTVPIAFYVERVRDELCITSCYPGAELCIDGLVACGRHPIPRRATVEVSGIRLELLVHNSPPIRSPSGIATGQGSGTATGQGSGTATGQGSGIATGQGSGIATGQGAAMQRSIQRTMKGIGGSKVPPPPPPPSNVPRANAAGDDWFNATFHAQASAKGSPSKPRELVPTPKPRESALPRQMKIPPRPPEPECECGSDLAETQLLPAIRTLSPSESMKTLEFKAITVAAPSVQSESDLGRGSVAGRDVSKLATRRDVSKLATRRDVSKLATRRAGVEGIIRPEISRRVASSILECESDSAPTQPILGIMIREDEEHKVKAGGAPGYQREHWDISLLGSLVHPRTRRPALFLAGALLGTLVPVLCVAGMSRFKSLARGQSSTYAAQPRRNPHANQTTSVEPLLTTAAGESPQGTPKSSVSAQTLKTAADIPGASPSGSHPTDCEPLKCGGNTSR